MLGIGMGNEADLKAAVANIGPIAISVDMTGTSAIRGYYSGVYTSTVCSNEPEKATHAMTVVGYGTTSTGQDYWIVRNSWGTKWGDNGYIKWARNKNNMCGIANWGIYPVF